ncbi:hypothetical protein EB796_012052 [Bugula neritina]|uniref:Uncharacterized protein n=1 Tax=Bugula neritina TaxID=10212 RepID=A0A7J7JUM3_BUGNE|nr:hypothetical protein EB796_012052 [Bugula neritina]
MLLRASARTFMRTILIGSNKKLQLAPPQFYSAVDTNPTNLYTSLAIMAAHPHSPLASSEVSMGWMKIAAGLALAIGVIFGLYRYNKVRLSQP